MIKAHCQPQNSAIKGTVNGATIAPILAPELKIPVARALSFLGNHSATVLIAAGKLPASLTPRALRAIPKPNTLVAKAWHTAATLQKPVALGDGVVVAVAARGIDEPGFSRQTAFISLRNDGAVDSQVDLFQLRPTRLGEEDRAAAKQRTHTAFVFVA